VLRRDGAAAAQQLALLAADGRTDGRTAMEEEAS